MTKQILLIGLGRFGKHIAKELYALGHQVLAVDEDEIRMNEALPYITNGQIGDCTNEAFLSSLGIKNFDVCIVTISNDFQASLECTYLLRELGAKLIVSRAERDGQAKFLLRNGADEVVYPEKQLAKWVAIRFSSDHILDYIQLDDEHAIFEVDMPESWIGKTVIQVDVRRKYGINIMGIKDNGKLNLTSTPDTQFHSTNTILVLGKYRDLQKCFHI